MPNHTHDCECLHCVMAKGYAEMGRIELDEASAYARVENEAMEYAIGA